MYRVWHVAYIWHYVITYLFFYSSVIESYPISNVYSIPKEKHFQLRGFLISFEYFLYFVILLLFASYKRVLILFTKAFHIR